MGIAWPDISNYNRSRRNLCLDGDGSFWANRGLTLFKPSAINTYSWGDRQVERIRFAAALAWRRAPWRLGARPSAAQSRRRVARSRHALRESRTVIGYDRLSTPADRAP
jgi:hypothetical protein